MTEADDDNESVSSVEERVSALLRIFPSVFLVPVHPKLLESLINQRRRIYRTYIAYSMNIRTSEQARA